MQDRQWDETVLRGRGMELDTMAAPQGTGEGEGIPSKQPAGRPAFLCVHLRSSSAPEMIPRRSGGGDFPLKAPISRGR